MLVLTRKVDQRIVIDDRIVVTVLAHGPNGVKLGIDAPREVPVHREEIQQRIHNGNTANHRPE